MTHAKWILSVATWGWFAVLVGTAVLGSSLAERVAAFGGVLVIVVGLRCVNLWRGRRGALRQELPP